MRIITRLNLLLIIFILIQNITFSQQKLNPIEWDLQTPYEKLYLHTDREFYFQGDSIWFKAYYLDGQTQQLIPGLNNMYVEIFNNNGGTIHSQVSLITNGISDGNIQIPDTLKSGNYLLRAFTDFQKNFGEDAYFYKSLTISKIKHSFDLSDDKSVNEDKSNLEIDVAFYPEGGCLLAGQLNTIGVKAIDNNGRNISVKGNIINKKGHIVSSFVTSYRGMGSFHFTPKTNEKYSVQIKNYPNYKSKFIKIDRSGIKVEFSGKENTDFIFQVTTNSQSFQKNRYHIAIMHRGQVLFHQEFIQDRKKFLLRIKQSILPAGINRFILLDEQLKPISERLFFSNKLNINNLDIKLEKDSYKQRSDVNINIFDKNEFSDESFSNLSVAIIDKNSAGVNGSKINILSSLLIDSELKGHIDSTTDYFIDEDQISSTKKLNLLMLTQGWSKYIWNSIPEKSIPHLVNETGGISISGKVKRLTSKKAVADGEVILGLSDSYGHRIYDTKSNTNGRFSFSNLSFFDTTAIYIQALNKKGRNSTEVLLDSLFEKTPIISLTHLQSVKTAPTIAPKKIHLEKYNSEVEMKKFNLKSGSILLDEVTVKAKRIEKDDGYTKSYGVADYSFKVVDAYKVTDNIQSFLQRSIPGISFTNSSIVLRQRVTGLSGTPTPSLVLLDGMPLGSSDLDFIKSLPMSSIDKIEVLKSAAKCVIYGAKANGGVVAIYSQKGQVINKDAYIKGVLTKKIIGYSGNKEFYSPKYTAENINTKKPDHRITLYWNPNIMTKNRKASFSFFTSDDTGTFKVFIEGITTNGDICLGTAAFTIDDYF